MIRVSAPLRRRFVLPAALLLAACGRAAAAEGPLVEVRLLLDGRVRPGAWAAVKATVEAGPAPCSGTLAVRAGPARYVKPLSLPASTRQVCLLPVFLPPTLPVPQAVFEGAGPARAALEPVLQEIRPGDRLIGVDPSAVTDSRLVLPVQEGAVQWVSLAWGDLEEVPELLDALDGLVDATPDRTVSAALEAHLGVWRGRGGRLFRSVSDARKALEGGGWEPFIRPPEGIQPLLTDLFPRAALPSRRRHLGRVALGVLLALGAAAAALAGWGRGRRVAAAAGPGGAAVSGCLAVAVLVPSGDVSLRGTAVREIVFPDGPASRRMAESVEGYVAADAAGAAELRFSLPPRSRVSVAAASSALLSRDARDVVEIAPRDGGWSVRCGIPAGGRRTFRFSRPGPAGEAIRVRIVREGGRPVRAEYEASFDEELGGVALVTPEGVYSLGGLSPKQAAGVWRFGEAPVDWRTHVQQAGPPGDPRRALREWWGSRRRAGVWLLADAAGDPLDWGGGPEIGIDWGPVLAAVRVE